MQKLILIRYAELSTKKSNINLFLKRIFEKNLESFAWIFVLENNEIFFRNN